MRCMAPSSTPISPQQPAKLKLLQVVRLALRRGHYSYRTEQSYLHWIRRFVRFHHRRHPRDMGAAEVTAFLNHLAAERRVASATQNQALSALLFLYGAVLESHLPWLDGIERAKRPVGRPTVVSPKEAGRLLAQMQGTPRLVAGLLYGAGLFPRQEPMGPPKCFDVSLPACHSLRTPADLRILAIIGCFVLASGALKPWPSTTSAISKLFQLSGHAVAPTAYRILCVRFTCLVRLLLAASATGATLDTGGWLALARPIAVGTHITARPPHRTERARFGHSAPALGV
jgi:hypothetical protein